MTVPVVADTDLVTRMAAGDSEALAALYDRYSAPIYALACRMLGERADAEEVTLDAFVQAWRNAKSYQPVRGSVPAWLTTIARNRALDLLRARQRRGRLAAVASAAPDLGTPGMSEAVPDASADAEQAERRRQVALALDTLSPVQREVVELAFYGGLTQTEIAARLGEPLGTVKTRARLAMQKLRIALGPYHFEQGA